MPNQFLGISAACYGARRFADALAMLQHAHGLGAAGIQIGVRRWDAALAHRLRETSEETGMFIEGQISLPQDQVDTAAFAEQARLAKEAGVSVLRTVALSGRRYETFTDAAAFEDFKARSWKSLTLAEPIMSRLDMTLAVENHKDWMIAELLDIMTRLSSAHVGVCLDTGNSISLLEDPASVIEAYAPFTVTTHFKDMDVRPYEDGFLLSEVPLGKGFIDLQRIIDVCEEHRSGVRHNLEMITRDPLEVPCLDPTYWATFAGRPGRDLATTLDTVRQRAGRGPLPRVSDLTRDERIQVEDQNIRESLEYARQQLKAPA